MELFHAPGRPKVTMSFRSETQRVLAQVEGLTGRPVVVQPDPSLRTIAKSTPARANAPAHAIIYNPAYEPLIDYLVCSQCGYLLRVFEAPDQARFDLVGTWRGRKDVEKLLAEQVRHNRLNYPKSAQENLRDQFFDGLMLQLRSVPVGLRVDEWVRRELPGVVEQQRVAVIRQLTENTAVLRPDVRNLAPAKVYDASAGMNAAFAAYWSRAWNDRGHAVPYKAAGLLARGEELLSVFDTTPAEPAADRQLVDAWGQHLGLAGWYELTAVA
jgi:hypothetical protein